MKRISILLVEDDASVGAATVAMLEGCEVNVFWATDVHEAVKQLCTPPGPPWDLMMLDLDLNGDRGESVVSLAEEGGCKLPPIVIVSAQSESECRNSATEVGAREVLRKPLRVDQLILMVERVIKDRPSGRG